MFLPGSDFLATTFYEQQAQNKPITHIQMGFTATFQIKYPGFSQTGKGNQVSALLHFVNSSFLVLKASEASEFSCAWIQKLQTKNRDFLKKISVYSLTFVRF